MSLTKADPSSDMCGSTEPTAETSSTQGCQTMYRLTKELVERVPVTRRLMRRE